MARTIRWWGSIRLVANGNERGILVTCFFFLFFLLDVYTSAIFNRSQIHFIVRVNIVAKITRIF